MAKFGKISLSKIPKDNSEGLHEDIDTLRASFLKFFSAEFPNKELLEDCKSFQKEYERLERAIFESTASFKKVPLIAAFLEWMLVLFTANPPATKEDIEDAKFLLKHGFIRIKDPKGGTWTIYHASQQDPNDIYEAIRCRKELPLSQRERLVNSYNSFMVYLEFRTHNYVIAKFDRDRQFVKNRNVKIEEFALFADQLKEPLQLVAKLLYYGGDRTLDEVLKLTIPQIDFEENLIQFGTQNVPYPAHIFADIQAIIGRRSTGKVFLGRQKSPLNPATVFRNFKEASSKSGLTLLYLPSHLTDKTYSRTKE